MHHTSLPRLPFAHARSLLCVSLCLLTGVAATAAPLQQVTLANGRLIELEDDFTWHYVVLAPSNSPTSNAVVTARSAATTGAAATPQATPTQNTPALNQQALQDPSLLAETAAQGVKIRYLDSAQDGTTIQPRFDVSNQAVGSVVRVTGQITVYDAQGRQLLTTETRFWQAEYRLPDTYLRQGQTRQFQVPAITLPQALPAGVHPLIRMTITDVERRS